jgi:hypothetical protein
MTSGAERSTERDRNDDDDDADDDGMCVCVDWVGHAKLKCVFMLYVCGVMVKCMPLKAM